MEICTGDAGYQSHAEFLTKELQNLSKDKKCIILELGIGHGSSLLINAHCKNNLNHKAFSFETDRFWFEQMQEKYELPNYIFNHINQWDNFENIFIEQNYDLVFVDQSPWEARINSINFLKTKTKTFILHDYDYFNAIDNPCENLFINNEKSWLCKNYCEDFILEDNYNKHPPTLIMRKK